LAGIEMRSHGLWRLWVGWWLLALAMGCGTPAGRGGADAAAEKTGDSPGEVGGADSGATPEVGPALDVAAPPDAGTGNDAVADGQPGDAEPAAALCPSLPAGNPADPVLTVIEGTRIVTWRRDGTGTTVATFAAELAASRLLLGGDAMLAEGLWVIPGGDGGHSFVQDLVLLDRAGTVRWRYERQVPLSSWTYGVWLDEAGAATVALLDWYAPGEGLVIRPDGSRAAVAGMPLGPAGPDGWVPVADPVLSDLSAVGPAAGFSKPGTQERRRLGLPLARADLLPILSQNRIIYLGAERGQTVLVVEGPTGRTQRALEGADVAALGVRATDSGVVVTMGEEPRWLALASPERIVAVAALPDAQASRRLLVQGDMGIILAQGASGEAPAATVDLVTGAVHAVATSPVGAKNVQIAGRWAVGVRIVPIWRVDLSSGEAVTLDYADAAPLHAFENTACVGYAPTVLPLADGRVPVVLRDDARAGLFVGDQNRAPWRRIGSAVSGVDTLTSQLIGETWVIRAIADTRLGCKTPWAAPADGSEPPIRGSSLQLVPPGDRPPLVVDSANGSFPQLTFHPSGRCVVFRGTAHDLPSGSSLDLRSAALAAWW
jgi:hypothetical protein